MKVHPIASRKPSLESTQWKLKFNVVRVMGLCVLFIVVSYPFLTIGHLFAPATLLGKNIYIVMPALFFGVSGIVIFLALNRKIVFAKLFLFLIILGVVAVVIWYARNVAYDENRSFLDFRYIFMAPLFVFVFANIINDQSRRDRVVGLLLLAAVMQSILGILHAHFFSYINIRSDDGHHFYIDTVFERTREAGTLISSNLYASVILCGLFLMVFYRRRVFYLENPFFKYSLFTIMLYGISLSGSRFPLLIGMVLTVPIVYRSLSSGWFVYRFVSFSLIGLMTFFFVYGKFESLSIVRFCEDSGGRLDKLLLGIGLVSSDPQSFLIGPSSSSAGEAETEDGVGISDNSYMLFALQFGVPFAIVWFYLLFNFLKNYIESRVPQSLFFFFLLTLGLYNSILWEIWLFYFIFTFLCISQNESEIIRGKMQRRYLLSGQFNPTNRMIKGCQKEVNS